MFCLLLNAAVCLYAFVLARVSVPFFFEMVWVLGDLMLLFSFWQMYVVVHNSIRFFEDHLLLERFRKQPQIVFYKEIKAVETYFNQRGGHFLKFSIEHLNGFSQTINFKHSFSEKQCQTAFTWLEKNEIKIYDGDFPW